MEQINAIGRCKAAVAHVYLTEGSGRITISKKDITSYSPSSVLQFIVEQPLIKFEVADKYDIRVNLAGGGFKGQSGAARLDIACALIKISPEDKAALRAAGLITHNPRAVKRKKSGRPKARKRF